MKSIFGILICCLFFFLQSAGGQIHQKNRVIILTDIENEPDDTESMVRLMLYSNQIDIEGLIATTSCWLRNRVVPASIRRVIDAYGKVRANLIKHDPDYPGAEYLLSKVKQGLPVYGMEGVGKGKDSEGSEWIIKILENSDERPLYISVWGGANTLAQALFKIRETKSKSEAEKLISKLRVYTISDQDDSGIWMRKSFPGLFYIVSPGDNYGNATWSAINKVVTGIDNSKISNIWILRNIQQGHGPLGSEYPDVSWGMEGDTPSWLSLITNGLNDPEHPEWGGWGGRYENYKPAFREEPGGNSGVPREPEPRAIWTNADDYYTPYILNEYGRAVKKDTIKLKSNHATILRWRDDFQNDFAARMDWCILSFNEANHPPVPVLAHPDRLTLKSGESFMLDATGTSDPDGDNLSYLWISYPEAGTCKMPISVIPENSRHVFIKAPEVESTVTAHFILKVTDKGDPQLSAYKRIIITVVPN